MSEKEMQWNLLLNEQRLRPKSPGQQLIDDVRTPFEADFDRIVFSTPCRRLQDKAQVFPLEPIDAVRTRLTHSMEVSCVARGIAKKIAFDLAEDGLIDKNQSSSIVTIASTCGLLHDFGNPPFGHAGEDAIREWFKARLPAKEELSEGESSEKTQGLRAKPQEEKDPNKRASLSKNILGELHPDLLEEKNQKYLHDLTNFEGNAQTLRLVMSLQILSDRWGLDLTAGTLSAAMKYIADSETVGSGSHSFKKLGFYQSERKKIQNVRDLTGIMRGRNPITLMMEAADDATYCAVDLEDGLKKGVIDWSVISEKVAEIGEFGRNLIKKTENRFNSSGDCGGRRAREECYIQYFRTLVISEAVKDVAGKFKLNYQSIMSGSFDDELLLDVPSDAANLYKSLKGLGKEYVWNSKETIRLELLGKNVIFSLMDHFYNFDDERDSKSFESKAYQLLSSSYRRIYESDDEYWNSLPKGYRRALLVTDYISGMTDSFAANLHRELTIG